jgi:hypothetical protein
VKQCENDKKAVVDDTKCKPSDRSELLTVQACAKPKCMFDWSFNDWSKCSVKCGKGGEKTRSAVCEDKGVKRSDDHCDADLKVTSLPCEGKECSYSWTYKPWGACSATCGAGVRTRKVDTCKDNASNLKEKKWCESKAKFLEEACPDNPECKFKWRTGLYDACSATCGNGTKKRTVSCVGDDGGAVSASKCAAAEKKPESVSDCVGRKCAYEWQYTDYLECDKTCGVGYKHREVKQCFDTVNKSKVDDAECARSPKELRSTCSLPRCKVYKWSMTEW